MADKMKWDSVCEKKASLVCCMLIPSPQEKHHSEIDSVCGQKTVDIYEPNGVYMTRDILFIKCSVINLNDKLKKELRHGWRILKKLANFFQVRHLPFAIRLNLLHPQPSLFLFGLLSPLWCFSTLVNYYFEVFFSLKVILHFAKMT